MIVNGVDVREYGAKLLTVEEQPPKISVQKEMIQRAMLPTEYETDIPLGTLKLTIYFRARNRAELQRTVSRFMMQFRQSAVLEEIKGYKGKYKAYLTDDSLTKTLDLSKKILELSIDGYFFDDDIRREDVRTDLRGKQQGRAVHHGDHSEAAADGLRDHIERRSLHRRDTGSRKDANHRRQERDSNDRREERLRSGVVLEVPAPGSGRKRSDVFFRIREGRADVYADVDVRRAAG